MLNELLNTTLTRDPTMDACFTAADGDGVADGRTVRRFLPLSFYPGFRLLQLQHRRWPERYRAYFIVDNDGTPVVDLDGTSPPIHVFNRGLPLRLERHHVRDYIQFFCFFVRGTPAKGCEPMPFLVTERLKDLHRAVGTTRSPELARAVRGHLHPVRVLSRGNGPWRVEASVFYGGSLYQTGFIVHPHGMVEMTDDTPVVKTTANVNLPLIA